MDRPPPSPETVFSVMVQSVIVMVAEPRMCRPPPREAVFSEMMHEDMVTIAEASMCRPAPL